MIRMSFSSRELKKKTKKFIKSIDNFSDPLSKFGGDYLKQIEKNFDQGGRLFGLWKPLADKTKKDRKRKGFKPARPILIRTGELLKSFGFQVKKKELKVFSDDPKAVYHQFGTKKMPQRKVIDITDRLLKSLEVRVGNFLEKQLKKVGFK